METGDLGRAAFKRVSAEIERIKGEAAREGSLFRRRMFEWFVLGFFIGMVAPVAGVGGVVLFTPLALAFTGLDVNAVGTAGLLLAMTDSAVAGRRYIRAGATELGLVLFVAAFMSMGVLAGAVLGLYVAKVGKVGVAALMVALSVLLFATLYLIAFAKPRDSATKSLRGGRWLRSFFFGVSRLVGCGPGGACGASRVFSA